MHHDTLRALWWIPNALTFYRGLVAGPAIFVLYAWEWSAWVGQTTAPDMYVRHHLLAFVLVTTAIWSEWQDGRWARQYIRYGWESKLGRDLDPFADKSFAICVLGAVLLHSGIDWHLLFLVPATGWVIWYSCITSSMRWNGKILSPNWEAKVKTGFLMAAKGIAIGGYWVETFLPQTEKFTIYLATLCVAIGSVICFQALEKYEKSAKALTLPAE